MLLFYAFAGLAVVTTWAIIYLYGFELLGIQPFGPFHFGESPYPNSDPVKILALASSIAFAAGVVILLMNRFAQAGKAGMGSYFDWIFLTIVIGVGATGMLAWALRLADMNAGYLVYYFHLVFIWSLVRLCAVLEVRAPVLPHDRDGVRETQVPAASSAMKKLKDLAFAPLFTESKP